MTNIILKNPHHESKEITIKSQLYIENFKKPPQDSKKDLYI